MTEAADQEPPSDAPRTEDRAAPSRWQRLVHPAIAEQLAQPRPRWWVLLLLYLAAAHGPTLVYFLVYVLVRVASPRVEGNTAQEPGGPILQGAFFALQVLAIFACTFHLLRRYRPAVSLLPPGTRLSRARTLGVVALLALPVVIWHGPAAVLSARAMGLVDSAITEDSALSRSPDLPPDRQALAREMAANSRETLRKAHEKVWAGFGRGPGVAAVLYTLILSLLLAPVFEELIFSGLALNLLCRRMRALLAVPLVMLLFALSHLPVAGLGLQLIPIAVLSLLAVTARLWTGTWLASIAIHMIFNACIFMPRLMIAATAFKHGVV